MAINGVGGAGGVSPVKTQPPAEDAFAKFDALVKASAAQLGVAMSTTSMSEKARVYVGAAIEAAKDPATRGMAVDVLKQMNAQLAVADASDESREMAKVRDVANDALKQIEQQQKAAEVKAVDEAAAAAAWVPK